VAFRGGVTLGGQAAGSAGGRSRGEQGGVGVPLGRRDVALGGLWAYRARRRGVPDLDLQLAPVGVAEAERLMPDAEVARGVVRRGGGVGLSVFGATSQQGEQQRRA